MTEWFNKLCSNVTIQQCNNVKFTAGYLSFLSLLFKQFPIKRALGSFPFIPESKIEPVIVFKLLVMQGVMAGADEPFAQRVSMKTFRIYLDIEVVDYTAEGHDG